MTASSQNGWPVLTTSSSILHTWVIPSRTGTFRLRLRAGSAGFLLAHFALWYADSIEKVAGRVLDDWGWAPSRPIRGTTTTVSNHASGTAVDLNALQHPLGTTTLAGWQKVKIRARLLIYRGAVRGGLDYHRRKDEMHYEIAAPLGTVERVARRMSTTDRGVRLLKANPGQRAVIWS